MAWLGKIKDVLKYIPYLWMGVKVLWQMYRARVKQEGFREALKKERDRRIALERDAAISDRLDDPIDERRERILSEAAERAKRGD